MKETCENPLWPCNETNLKRKSEHVFLFGLFLIGCFIVLQMEQLYVEVLYTIRHKLGAHSAKYPHHFKEDLVHYAQTAFGVGQEYHRRCNAIASEEKVINTQKPDALQTVIESRPLQQQQHRFSVKIRIPFTPATPPTSRYM